MNETDRALRDLQGAVGAVRGPGADPDAALPRAGTAVLLRGGDAGPEVLMMRRPDRGSFGGAWVFPGGRVEPADEVAGADPIDDARRAAARETSEEVGLVVDAGLLVPISRWDPPPGIAKRIRTWFYAGAAGQAELALSADEVAAVVWVRPEDALARHAQGELMLYPPTWVTLHGLIGFASVADLLRAAQGRGIHSFATTIRDQAGDAVFVWRPDAAYDSEVPLDAPGARHRLETATLPWQYIVADGAPASG